METAKARVETLEGMDDYFNKLDTRDITARRSLSKEAYEKVYNSAVEVLQKSTEAVKKVSLDSAFIFARIADTFSKRYNMPVEEVAAQIQTGGQVGGYAQSGVTAQERLDQDEMDWSEKMDTLEQGRLPDAPVQMMFTPLALQLAGVKSLPVYIDISKLKKIQSEHPYMTTEVLKQIPRSLADPIMITTSGTVPGHIVVSLALKADGINVVVPFELNVKKKGVNANVVTSAYNRATDVNGKRVIDYDWFQKNITQGRLLYVDRTRISSLLGMSKQKTIAFLKPAGVQFSLGDKKRNGLLIRKIPDESDLVKLRQQNLGYYQTVYQSISKPKKPRKRRWKNLDIEYLRSNDIFPVNDVTDEAKYSALAKEFEENGYNGRPILVIRNEFGQEVALTGSHRIYAAREAGISVPTVVIDVGERPDVDYSDLMNATDDDARLAEGEVLYEKKAIGKEHLRLLRIEADRDSDDYGYDWGKGVPNHGESIDFFQTAGGQYAGSYDPMQNIISLFQKADESTVIHESAHMYLTMLERIAETNMEAGKELFTIQQWAAFSESTLKEYEGTDRYEEFSKYAEAIRKNLEDVGAQERWMQERLAGLCGCGNIF